MIKKFRRKIFVLLFLIYFIIALLFVIILNFSYVRNNRESISKMLNMKFQMGYLSDDGTKMKEIKKYLSEKKIEKPKKESSISKFDVVSNSCLVVKDSDKKFYVADVPLKNKISDKELLKIAKNILKTGKKSGNHKNYQFEITVSEDNLLIGFADITTVMMRERKYICISIALLLIGGGVLFLPIQKIAQRMVEPLEEAMRLQNEFVMFAGHELKTPVTVMKASLKMLKKSGVENKYLNYVEEENEKMRKLIVELLDYSKLEHQQKETQPERINLTECIEGTTLEFEVMAFEKGLQFEDDIDEDIYIIGNNDKLQRMTEALLENAVKYTKENCKIGVLLKRRGKKAKLSIGNQGKEIPEEERKKIFEKFYQPSKAEGNHYGLGLAIAQMIARQHHAEIKVIYKEGWNYFYIEFPVSDN